MKTGPFKTAALTLEINHAKANMHPRSEQPSADGMLGNATLQQD
jgi:hypothetical protein